MADNIILLWDSPYSSVGGLVLQAAYIICFSESFAAKTGQDSLLTFVQDSKILPLYLKIQFLLQ
jgi:hypothetical protein